jgi:excisionase family DNA binding protein
MEIKGEPVQARPSGPSAPIEGEFLMQRLVTVKEAAELLACSEAAVRKWIYQQRLPKVKVGRLTRLRQSDVEALITGGLEPSRQ